VSDFEALVEELLKSRPELTRQELMKRIAEKKETVGAGYLTDQGALFLVAGELGVSLQPSISSDLSLKDLHIGANDITVVARVLAVYPTTTYNKKDGGSGRYRRLVLFDKGTSSRLTIWDESVDDPDKLGITTGSALRVVSGYVKQGLDGKPNLNLGKKGRLELVENSKLPTLDDVSEKLTKATEERPVIALECTVTSEPRYSEFVRSDGSPGSLYQFGVGAQAGKEQQRLVVWNPSVRPELKAGDRVRVTNLKFKRTSRGDFELNGDAGSAIVPITRKEVGELRIAAISATAAGSLIFGLDKDKRLKVVETQLDTAQFKPGDAIAVSPDQESGGRMVCRSPGSLTSAKVDGVPGLAELAVKVKDAKDESSQIMVEVIALSHGSVDDVDMRDGTVVKKGELMVGDDTGEIKVVGWREHSSKLSGIQPGERLRIIGLAPKQTKMGAWTLQLSALTAIEKLKVRT
jgi:ssDNA-binding replication factor A large subunit